MDEATKGSKVYKPCIYDGRFYNISLSEITIASNYRAEIKVNSMVKTSKMLYPEHLSKYPEHLIDDAYHRAIKSHHNSNVSRDPIQNVLTLPLHRPFLPLVNIFKHHFNITIVFHYNNTVKNILINNNPNKPEACIYKIPCANCPLVYVGQTGKSLEARVKQHKYSIRSGQENSALFQHLRGFNH